MFKYFFYHFPWQFLMVVIYVQSSFGKIPVPDLGVTWQDKILHFVVFGIMAFLLARSLKRSEIKIINRFYLAWAFSLTSIYGIFDEFHQYFVVGRYSTIADWLADTIGAAFFIMIYIFLVRYAQKYFKHIL